MPSTVNGIGTTYYGRKDVQVTRGVCRNCGAAEDLTSYNTRLWFVIFFIPIIPLGRKRVIEFCPSCTGHRAVSLQEWNRIGRETVKESLSEASKNPDDPDAAVQMHASLAMFDTAENALEFARVMESKFANNVEILLYLGSWYEDRTQTQDAERCFNRAFALDPQNPNTRRAVAVGCIEKGDLDRARELLNFMEKPGPDQDPGALAFLARGYQNAGRNREALEIYTIIATCFPEIAQRNREFRKAVRRTEEALGFGGSILPGRSRRALRIAVALLVAVPALAFFGHDYYVKKHQTLYIVNGFRNVASVSIPGVRELAVNGRSTAQVALPEGDYKVRVSLKDREPEEVDVRIRGNIATRLRNNSVFVLNPGGGAVIGWQAVPYGKVDPGRVPRFRLHVADRFMTFRSIDYAFEDLPKTLPGSRSGGQVKTALRTSPGNAPASLAALLAEKGTVDKVLAYAEAHLMEDPDDENMLLEYWNVCRTEGQVERGFRFLDARVGDRPVLASWHRYYQELGKSLGKDLIGRYDVLLKDNPKDSTLLYLRGRLATRASEGFHYMTQAIEADPNNSYPHYAQAHYWLSRGEYAKAKAACAQALRLKPTAAYMKMTLFEIRFALGEYDTLDAEIARALKQDPHGLRALGNLLEVRVAQGDVAGAQSAASDVLSPAKAAGIDDDPHLAYVRIHLAYLLQDHAAVIADQRVELYPLSQGAVFDALLCQSKPGDAEKTLGSKLPWEEGYANLLLRLAYLRSRDPAAAGRCLSEGISRLERTSGESRLIARILQKKEPDGLTAAEDIILAPAHKSILFVTLADLYPEKRAQLLDTAEKMNVGLDPPHNFLKLVIDEKKKEK